MVDFIKETEITIFRCLIKGNMNRIKEVLTESGLKQTWLSEKLGKSYNMVNSYCQNRRQPSVEDLFKIGEQLQTDPRDLLVAPTKPSKQ